MCKLIRLGVLLLGLTSLFAVADSRPRLVFLNWGDYIAPELVDAFEQRYRVDVVEHFFTSDQQRSLLLQASAGEGFDLILVAGSDLRLYAQQGWLAPLNEALVPTLVDIDSTWRNAFSGTFRYGMPYFWGTTGIAYRADLLTEAPGAWMDLFRPNAELKGAVQMTDDSSELVQAALKALGYSLNSEVPQEVAEARQLLLDQLPDVVEYAYSAELELSPLLSGRARAAYCYNGDALMLQELNPNIRYVVPEEGTNLWADYIAVGAKAREPELAHLFLNFINEPVHAARNARYLYSASPNRAARALLSEEMRTDPLIYPSPEQLERSEFSRMITEEMLKQRREIGVRLGLNPL